MQFDGPQHASGRTYIRTRIERVCMVTVSNTRAGELTPTYPYTYQADLEKIERDLAESKKVSVLAGRGRMH